MNHLKALLNRKSYYMVYIPYEQSQDTEISFFNDLNLAVKFALKNFDMQSIIPDKDLDFDLKIFENLNSDIKNTSILNLVSGVMELLRLKKLN